MKTGRLLSHAVVVLGALMLGATDMASGARVRSKPPVPDFTKGGEKDGSHDWKPGPTGARGSCNGYGAMNSPGIVLATAMVIAREAGVKDPDVDLAIASSSGFLHWYANKGAHPLRRSSQGGPALPGSPTR